jgi:hypothetical protein
MDNILSSYLPNLIWGQINIRLIGKNRRGRRGRKWEAIESVQNVRANYFWNGIATITHFIFSALPAGTLNHIFPENQIQKPECWIPAIPISGKQPSFNRIQMHF